MEDVTMCFFSYKKMQCNVQDYCAANNAQLPVCASLAGALLLSDSDPGSDSHLFCCSFFFFFLSIVVLLDFQKKIARDVIWEVQGVSCLPSDLKMSYDCRN